MRTTRAMRKLGSELLEGARLTPPADVGEIIGALCAAYAERRGGGRKVDFQFSSFPPDTASGLWLELDDVDLIVVEQHTRPEHQLVIACHELWHLDEGSCDSVGPGMLAAARLAGHPGRLAELLSSEPDWTPWSGRPPHAPTRGIRRRSGPRPSACTSATSCAPTCRRPGSSSCPRRSSASSPHSAGEAPCHAVTCTSQSPHP